MRYRLFIPEAVLESIAQHMDDAIARTLAEFESAEEDEDSMTGHLGSKLTVLKRQVYVEDPEIPGPWTWSLQYRKFRGRGPGATEKLLGADGIFELALERKGSTEIKSLLFQSKMEGAADPHLVDQCAKLSTWREAAVILSYSPEAISAVSIDDALAARGSLERAPSMPLAAYMHDLFLPCSVGDNDLRYNARSRMLVWRTMSGEIVATRFPLKQRIRVKVQPPGSSALAFDREIRTEDIHRYRMDAKPDELLTTSPGMPAASPNKAIKALSKIYHPDLYGSFSDETREMVKVRMQEFNEAYQSTSPKRPR